jgi:hypothetical protein
MRVRHASDAKQQGLVVTMQDGIDDSRLCAGLPGTSSNSTVDLSLSIFRMQGGAAG